MKNILVLDDMRKFTFLEEKSYGTFSDNEERIFHHVGTVKEAVNFLDNQPCPNEIWIDYDLSHTSQHLSDCTSEKFAEYLAEKKLFNQTHIRIITDMPEKARKLHDVLINYHPQITTIGLRWTAEKYNLHYDQRDIDEFLSLAGIKQDKSHTLQR